MYSAEKTTFLDIRTKPYKMSLVVHNNGAIKITSCDIVPNYHFLCACILVTVMSHRTIANPLNCSNRVREMKIDGVVADYINP